VPNEIWDEAARHYDEVALASLVLAIATVNLWNRLNAATRQVAGEWAAA
jgi:alkylhydroperoxidase family enzyme